MKREKRMKRMKGKRTERESKDGLSLQTPKNPRTEKRLRPTPASWG